MDSDPEIWRTLVVEPDTTLGDLHYVIQTSMGWDNSHLHQFLIKGKIYGVPDLEVEDHVEDEECATVGTLVLRRVRKFRYEYDFGDSWLHEIEILRKLSHDPKLTYPVCLLGENACPPEDSGGLPGYYSKLEALKDKTNEEYQVVKEWMGTFDPKSFDTEAVNKMFQKDRQV